ncbi:MAG TPA: hypothetical protein VGO53_16260 [Steroidobacteraceae bacterium]|nr:hypothetical protein [Steroidobacteraceae bacterium]
MKLETAIAERDEARLRINLIVIALNEEPVYPVPERHANLVRAVIDALQPVRELLK